MLRNFIAKKLNKNSKILNFLSSSRAGYRIPKNEKKLIFGSEFANCKNL